jgi:hypothetical protein
MWALIIFLPLVFLSGCRHEDVTQLNRSELPWASPVEWEKNAPIAPGFQY